MGKLVSYEVIEPTVINCHCCGKEVSVHHKCQECNEPTCNDCIAPVPEIMGYPCVYCAAKGGQELFKPSDEKCLLANFDGNKSGQRMVANACQCWKCNWIKKVGKDEPLDVSDEEFEKMDVTQYRYNKRGRG